MESEYATVEERKKALQYHTARAGVARYAHNGACLVYVIPTT